MKVNEQRVLASFTDMASSTEADWRIILNETSEFMKALPDRVLSHLRLLGGDFGGFKDRLTHSLQTATRAHQDGRG